MRVIAAVAVIAIAGLGLFIAWFMLKGVQADFQLLKGAVGRYPQKKHKYLWSSALAIPVCVSIGGVVGAVAGSGLTSSLEDDVIGGAVAYLFIIFVALFVGRPEKSEPQ